MRGLILCLAGAQAAIPAASAGPWTQEAGHAYLRAVALGQRIEGVTAGRAELYAEYGLTARWTATLKGEVLRIPETPEFNQTGYRATLRRVVFRRQTAAIALEGGLVGGEAIGGIGAGCAEPGLEARVSTGVSGVNRGKEWWLAVDGVGRFHSGGCDRQRVELGAGREVARDWFLTSQFFLQRGSAVGRSDKWEGGIARRFGRTEIGVGVRHEFSGLFRETGGFLAVSRRF